MTIRDILRKNYLEYKLSPLDAGILLSLAGNFSKEFILAHPEKKLSVVQIKKMDSFCARRASGEPIAYIAGKKEFFGLEFLVNKNVLIPRPETELLVEGAIERIKKFPDKLDIIDIGTGSGNIIISIAKNIPEKIRRNKDFYAIDISKASLQVAKKNAEKNKVEKKIKFIQSDMLEYFFPPKADQSLVEKRKTKPENVFIIANLPYVSPALYRRNEKNLKFEPKSALHSRNKGLAHYDKMFQQLRSSITGKCCLLIEFSPEQKPDIGRISKKYWPKSKVKFSMDLAKKWRMAEIRISS
ncbi:MAG: peptide chain release factor N(5)-glutamine methyltransferase [Parcubacteria group bacterium]|jgi:release factor glutamine methyltransferase